MYKSLQDGQTSLMRASHGGHVGCVKLLLERGAQVNHQDEVSGIRFLVRCFYIQYDQKEYNYKINSSFLNKTETATDYW